MTTGKARGGRARAKALTAERRKEIAKKAATSRWGVVVATHGSPDHPLRIGDIEIPCYVLEDGTRVLSQRGLQSGIGMSASGGRAGEQRIATFLDSLEQKGIDIKGLSARIRNPLQFRPPGGGRSAFGFEATILADICDVVLDARKKGLLLSQQERMADQCEILVRGFARVGIIALVDEATGFQRDRARRALAEILEAFVAEELKPWVKTFPEQYYEHLFRLRGLDYPSYTIKRPQYFGHLTNNIVYSRLAPTVLAELKRGTPKTPSGNRRYQFHRRLTEDVGHPKLREHLASVITLMKISDDWTQFIKHLDRAHPKFNTTLQLPFGETEPATGI